MLHSIDRFARRAVAYPLVLFGWALTSFAKQFIVLGAWLMDHEDLLTKDV